MAKTCQWRGAQFLRDVKLAQKRSKDMGTLREVILVRPDQNLSNPGGRFYKTS